MMCLDLYQIIPKDYGMGALHRRKHNAAVPAFAVECNAQETIYVWNTCEPRAILFIKPHARGAIGLKHEIYY